jgi:hypothetical protein
MDNVDLLGYLGVFFLGIPILIYSVIIAGNVLLGLTSVVGLLLVVELARMRRVVEQHLIE